MLTMDIAEAWNMQSNTQQLITFQSKNVGFFKVVDNVSAMFSAGFTRTNLSNYTKV